MFTFLMVSILTAYAGDNSNSPAYLGAVSIVVTIMLVLLCIWLLNSHNVTRKVKYSRSRYWSLWFSSNVIVFWYGVL